MMKSAVRHTPVLLGILAACKSSTTGPAATNQVVTKVSGDSQMVAINTAASNPLVVKVTDENGAPVPNVIVTFAGQIGGAFSAAANTDADGLTQTTFTASTFAGVDTITAGSALAGNKAIFVFTILPGPPHASRKLAGDGQIAAQGAKLQFPFVMDVKDQYGNNISGVEVTWTASCGTLDAGSIATDSEGEAKNTLTLPNTAGDCFVTAHVEGLPDLVFIATAS